MLGPNCNYYRAIKKLDPKMKMQTWMCYAVPKVSSVDRFKFDLLTLPARLQLKGRNALLRDSIVD